MLEDSLKKIEEAISKVGALDSDKKGELIRLLNDLKSEIKTLAKTNAEHARSIAGLTEQAAHEATRQERSETLAEHSIEGLALSAKGFEASHPRLVEVLNAICSMLAKIGI